MIELDYRMLTLRAEAHELARALRERALELDADPDAIRRYLDVPAIRYLSTTLIPQQYRGEPYRIGPYRYDGMSCLERVVVVEELARGDAGAMLAAPGPSLSGVLVHELADEAQKQWYYSRLLAKPTWTFFALTEPDLGSDATQLTTALRPSQAAGTWLLSGAKRYIGNGVRAELGVVIARRSTGPLGITAALVDTSAPGFAATAIPTVGLRAARLSALTLTDIQVPDDRILGRHLSASRRGMRGVVRTFNQIRPGVAALAVGLAAAALDYVRANRRTLSASQRHEMEKFDHRIAAVRQLIYRAAVAVDADADNGLIGSAAKARAAALAEQASLFAPQFFGQGARLDHPMLDKLARDARGFEFMEGTSNIQKLTLFHGFAKGRLAHA
jgi:alkylation response protein AidB-like acyl-CoA dehydrogenase